MIGNSGNNWLDGMGGNDTLSGGLGADGFYFGPASGIDVITDFAASDMISVHAYSHGTAYGGGIAVTQSGADTVIDLGGGNTVTVLNTVAATVTNSIIW